VAGSYKCQVLFVDLYLTCVIFLCRNKWRTREPNRQEVGYVSILFKYNLLWDTINFGVFNTLYKSLTDWVSIYGFMQIKLVVTCIYI
jgi:hypothetical protein